MYGLLTDGIKEAVVTFSSEKLARMKELHGSNLRVFGDNYTQQPAAPGTATVVSKMGDLTARIKPKPAKVKLDLVVVDEPAVKRPITQKVAKVAKPTKQHGGHNSKAVVSLTTGEYFESVKQAAELTGGHPTSIYEQLSGKVRMNGSNGKGRVRRSVNGHAFRFATPLEKELKKMIFQQPYNPALSHTKP